MYKFKDCAKCRGDLVLEGDEWRCWQCGTYYYPKEPVMDLPKEPVGSQLVLRAADFEVEPRRGPRPQANGAQHQLLDNGQRTQ